LRFKTEPLTLARRQKRLLPPQDGGEVGGNDDGDDDAGAGAIRRRMQIESVAARVGDVGATKNSGGHSLLGNLR
jgi:hypothetical protein